MLSFTFKFVFIALFSFLMTACGKSGRRPNVVILAVEGLGFDRLPCQSDLLTEGFATLCQESIRFTHAYGNSTNSVANLTTVLTGLFPWEHGLRGQGQWLRPHRQTIGELALKRGYRTAFISGGLPILSKTGLGQGFENFDDRIDLFKKPRFRPAENVVDNFISWTEQLGSEPFLSVLHFTDLFYPYEASQTRDGEARELSVAAQGEEISEQFQNLIAYLKKENLWNDTYVFVLGLSGGQDPSSLKSSQTQVTLMIKPRRVKRDQGTAWGVDLNVSLADVGASLFEIFDETLPERYKHDRNSLSSIYTQPKPDWAADRFIMTEMYWAFENFGLDVVRSVRRNHFLYIHGDPPLLFNALSDRQEQNPLPFNDNIYAFNFDSFRGFLERGIERGELPEIPDWFYQGVEGFRRGQWDRFENSNAEVVRGWLLRYRLENREFLKVAADEEEFPLLRYVVAGKLGEPVDRRSMELVKSVPCGEAFIVGNLSELENLREHCDQDRLLQYVDWARFKGTSEELFYENRFRRSFLYWWSQLELGAMNYASFGALGLPLSWPRPPDVSELFLIHREKKPRRTLMEGFTSK